MAIRAMVQGVAQKSFDPILIFLAHSPAACSASLSPNLTSLSPAPAEAIRLLASNATTQASILHLNSAPLYVQGTSGSDAAARQHASTAPPSTIRQPHCSRPGRRTARCLRQCACNVRPRRSVACRPAPIPDLRLFSKVTRPTCNVVAETEKIRTKTGKSLLTKPN